VASSDFSLLECSFVPETDRTRKKSRELSVGLHQLEPQTEPHCLTRSSARAQSASIRALATLRNNTSTRTQHYGLTSSTIFVCKYYIFVTSGVRTRSCNRWGCRCPRGNNTPGETSPAHRHSTPPSAPTQTLSEGLVRRRLGRRSTGRRVGPWLRAARVEPLPPVQFINGVQTSTETGIKCHCWLGKFFIISLQYDKKVKNSTKNNT
jgi:hypothetical protein